MLVRASKDAGQLQATRRVKAWTRKRFGLDRKIAVMAAQISCDTPGCPPIETIVAFWGGDGTRYRFKVFKPIAEVVYDDLPYAWFLPALVDDGGLGLECC